MKKRNVMLFRTLKHGDPERRLQMIHEPPRSVSGGSYLFPALAALAAVIGYAIVTLALGPS